MNLLAQYLNYDAYQGALSSLKTHDTAWINQVGRAIPLPSLWALKQGSWSLEHGQVGVCAPVTCQTVPGIGVPAVRSDTRPAGSSRGERDQITARRGCHDRCGRCVRADLDQPTTVRYHRGDRCSRRRDGADCEHHGDPGA